MIVGVERALAMAKDSVAHVDNEQARMALLNLMRVAELQSRNIQDLQAQVSQARSEARRWR